MMSKVCTVRTTARAAVHTDTGWFFRDSRHYKPKNDPIIKSKIIVFTKIKVVK